MKREVSALLASGVDSLVLGIDHFNRCDDRGRQNATLILLCHSLEMLLKASIVHKGGLIREKSAPHTIGFKTAVAKGLSDGTLRMLTDQQAVLLRATYGLRSAAQHHLLRVSEPQLYLHVQGVVTLFADVYGAVFGKDVSAVMPPRVLPVSTTAPLDIEALFLTEITEILKLLAPGRRSRAIALSRLEPLAILDAATLGVDDPPQSLALPRMAKRLRDGEGWDDVFKGAASLSITTESTGHKIQLRFSKKEGLPVVTVPAGTPGASSLAVKRVNELDFYNLSHPDLREKCGLTPNKLTAYIWYLGLKDNEECAKEIVIGKSRFVRYSQNAISRVRDEMITTPPEEMWGRYKLRSVTPPRSVDGERA